MIQVLLQNSNVPEGYNIKGFSMTIQKVVVPTFIPYRRWIRKRNSFSFWSFSLIALYWPANCWTKGHLKLNTIWFNISIVSHSKCWVRKYIFWQRCIGRLVWVIFAELFETCLIFERMILMQLEFCRNSLTFYSRHILKEIYFWYSDWRKNVNT